MEERGGAYRAPPSADIRRTMRLALLSAANSVHTVRWANAFAERGCEVLLITQHEPIAGLSSAVTVQRLRHWGGAGYVLNSRRVLRSIRSFGAEVVNVHYASGYGTLVRALRGFPVVLNVWGSDVFEFPARSGLHRRWLLANLRSAQCVVSTSHAMADRVREIFPSVRALEVVPFGVDLDLFRPADQETSATGLIGTVKTLAPTYGVDRLLQAFALLRAKAGMGAVRLRVVGNGPDRAHLQGLAAALGVAGAVEFAGAVPHAQVPAELRGLDVYVALSRAESFGVAIIEASACGIPVVVSDAGGLPEVVRHGITGFVVPKGDPQEAAERLAQIMADPDLRKKMGAMGRIWVQEQFEWKQCADRMVRILQNAVRT